MLFSFDSKQPRPRPFADVEAGVAFLQQAADIGGHIFLVLRQQRADRPTPAPAPELQPQSESAAPPRGVA